jgi:hypothetical protein
VVELIRGADLLDRSVRHYDDPVGQRHRLFWSRNQDGRGLQAQLICRNSICMLSRSLRSSALKVVHEQDLRQRARGERGDARCSPESSLQ